MGFKNHQLFIEKNKHLFRGPFLEIGSRDYGSTFDIRSLFPGEHYVGVDMSPGKGVDQVLDLTRPFSEIDEALGGQRFGTVFCLSVLEHCDQPFLMAENITLLLKQSGCVYVSVPYIWKFHGYPSDYWRFTHEGVRKLFLSLRFDMHIARLSTDVEGDFRVVTDQLSKFRISGSWMRKNGASLLQGLSADLLSGLGMVGPLRWLTRYRYLMPPTMIDMVGWRVGQDEGSKYNFNQNTCEPHNKYGLEA